MIMFRNFNPDEFRGVAAEDVTAIDNAIELELDLYIDQFDRAWINEDIYIADVVRVCTDSYTEESTDTACANVDSDLSEIEAELISKYGSIENAETAMRSETEKELLGEHESFEALEAAMQAETEAELLGEYESFEALLAAERKELFSVFDE